MNAALRPKPVQSELLTLGRLCVNGCEVSQYRVVELIAFLAEHGGPAQRTLLEDALFECGAAPSSVATLACRARKLGVEIAFVHASDAYTLVTPVRCDHLQVLEALRLDCWPSVLALYRGPYLTRSKSPYATAMRTYLVDQLTQRALALGDPQVLDALTRVVPDATEVWERLAGLGHPRASVICQAMRRSLAVAAD